MRIYHDWEFLENGETIKPISVGMVRQDGKELYYEFADAPWKEIEGHPWLLENVMPHLSFTEHTYLPREAIMQEVYNFLLEAYVVDRDLQLWGWYSAYDHVCLAQLFGRMIDLPDFCPMWTNDLRQEFHRLGNPGYPRQTEGLHNALSDAKHLKGKHEWLLEFETARVVSRGIQFGNGNTQNNVF